MSDIFREIDEELRRDNLMKLWQRYGKYVVVAAVVIVAATAVGVGWHQYARHQREALGVRYAAALALAIQGKDKEAADAFAAMSAGDGGRALLARFEEAALKAKDDPAGAAALYDAIAGDGALAEPYRDVAVLLGARLALDTGDAKAAVAKLAPLTDAGNPWHPTALELTALAQLKDGDSKAARATYQRIAGDAAAPAGLRQRAGEMVTVLQ